jgi:hypothetical protein
MKVLKHLLSEHDVLFDQAAAVPRQELEADMDRVGFVLQDAEAIDSGAVHREQVGVVGFIARVGGLAVLFSRVRMEDADLEACLGEGALDRPVVASGPLDHDDHVLDLVPSLRVAHLFYRRFEARPVVLDYGWLQEHAAIEVGQHHLGAILGAIDTKDREMLRADRLHPGMNDTPRLLKYL